MIGVPAFGQRAVRDATSRGMAELAAKPPEGFVSILRKQLGHPAVPDQVLHRSLARVLDAQVEPAPAKVRDPTDPGTRLVGPAAPPRGQQFELRHHLGNKSSLVRELWEAIDGSASSLGSDVTRRIRKQYIGYFRGKKSFCTAEIQKSRVLVYLSLTRETAEPWNEEVMRDTSKIGHFGMGDVAYSLVTVEQLEELRRLILLAYEQKSTTH